VPAIEPVIIEDAAHRVADTMRLHILAASYDQWAAFRLAGGESDGIAYPSFKDARRMQATFMQDLTMYLRIPRDDFSADTAQRLLNYWRAVRDAGGRPPDPDDYRGENIEPIIPERIEEL
jgi:hypothetical protein